MEEEIWKCEKHPTNRRRNGICPSCLYERLVLLCANCANVRPCDCCAHVDRVSNLIESEPSFRRSRSVAIPFLRSKLAISNVGDRKTMSIWSVFKASKSKKGVEEKKMGELIRSRSMSVEVTNGKRWHFPSPFKAFRQSKISSVLHQRSPLYR